MTTTTIETKNRGLAYWINLVLETRKFGSTYVHADVRNNVFAFRACALDGIVFSFCSYGQSIPNGGHKYKVHARYEATGKPVPSKVLMGLK